MDYINIFKTIIALAISFITYVFGTPDMWLGALVIVIVADYITGLARAWILNELSNKEGFKGIVKKLMYFAVVAVAMIVDKAVEADSVIRVTVMCFLIINEGVSILENCAKAAIPVPDYLMKILHKFKGDE